MIELVENKLNKIKKPSTIGIFATEGTIKSKLFNNIIERCSHKAFVSSRKIQDNINECLYGDVKEKGTINFERYHNTLKEMMDQGCDYIIIGCTEASYINSKDENSNLYPLIDSEKELVNESLKLGLKLQKNIEI